MFKMIGGLAIIFAGFMAGRCMGYQHIERNREIQEFFNLLSMLETEIGYGQTILPLAAERLAEISTEPHRRFFSLFREYLEAHQGLTADQAWQRVIAETARNFCMRKEDWEILRQFGRALGSSGGEDQVRHLKVAQKRLEQLEKKSGEEAQKMSHLWNYVGVLTSMALVILLY